MPLTVSITHPDFPEGTELYVAGLPPVPNGGSVEVSEQEERAFVSEHKMTVEEAVKSSEIVSISGSSSLEGNVADILGVDPETISDRQSGDPTEVNKQVAEKNGFPVELISVGGISTDPVAADEGEVSTAMPTSPSLATSATAAGVEAGAKSQTSESSAVDDNEDT